MRHHLTLLKPYQSLHLSLALLAGAIISSLSITLHVFLAFTSAFFLGAAAFSAHQLIEHQLERNASGPFLARHITKQAAIAYVVAFLTLGLGLAYVASPLFFKVASVGIGTALLYSFYLKEIPVVGTAVKSLAFGCIFMLGSALQGTVTMLATLLSISSSLLLFAYFTLRQIDEAQERNSILGLLGDEKTRLLANAVVVAGLILLLVPYKIVTAGTFYTIGLVPAISLGLYSLLESDPSKANKFVLYTIYWVALAFVLDALF